MHYHWQADKEKRSSWLISSNPANEGFYNTLGFKTEKEILLGDDNPTWTGPPIVVALVRALYIAASTEPYNFTVL